MNTPIVANGEGAYQQRDNQREKQSQKQRKKRRKNS
jgi:hypothetical protein